MRINALSTSGASRCAKFPGGVAVKCAGAAYQMSTERTEAEETAIYTEKWGSAPLPYA